VARRDGKKTTGCDAVVRALTSAFAARTVGLPLPAGTAPLPHEEGPPSGKCDLRLLVTGAGPSCLHENRRAGPRRRAPSNRHEEEVLLGIVSATASPLLVFLWSCPRQRNNLPYGYVDFLTDKECMGESVH
jgi:hypothetical protein